MTCSTNKIQPWHKWAFGVFLGVVISVLVGMYFVFGNMKTEDHQVNISPINRTIAVETTTGRTSDYWDGLSEYKDSTTPNYKSTTDASNMSYTNNFNNNDDTSEPTFTEAINSSISQMETKSIEMGNGGRTERIAPSTESTTNSVPITPFQSPPETSRTTNSVYQQTPTSPSTKEAMGLTVTAGPLNSSYIIKTIMTTTTPSLQPYNASKAVRPPLATNCIYRNGNSAYKCFAAKPTYKSKKLPQFFQNTSSKSFPTTNKPA